MVSLLSTLNHLVLGYSCCLFVPVKVFASESDKHVSMGVLGSCEQG